MPVIVRAIDVGHKNVKSVIETDGSWSARCFRVRPGGGGAATSPIPLGASARASWSTSTALPTRSALMPRLAAKAAPAHNMDDDYCLSDEYLGLACAARWPS